MTCITSHMVVCTCVFVCVCVCVCVLSHICKVLLNYKLMYLPISFHIAPKLGKYINLEKY